MVMVSAKYFLKTKLCSLKILMTKVAEDLGIEELAWESKFYRSDPKKITATGLVFGFWNLQDGLSDTKEAANTLATWCLHTGMVEEGIAISKQALDNRLNERTVELAKLLLQAALNLKVKTHFREQKLGELKGIYTKFNNILIQDSTMQKLPAHLSEQFPSSHSHGKEAATLRLQAIYNFTEEHWVQFELGGFTDNDQSKAMMITKIAQKRDLILRDLGYFTLESLAYLIKNQFVITSWDKKTNMYDPETDKKINLLSLFKGKKTVDQIVLVGSKAKLSMRLVALKLPEHIAAERIRKAKADRHSRANHSAMYYELLKWDIFLTNVPKEMLSPKEIVKLYGLRWYIEILFKAWKSFSGFSTILSKQKMSTHRTLVSIYLMLTRFVYYMADIYQYVKQKVAQKTDQFISILKFLDVCRKLADQILHIQELEELDWLIPQFVRFATYDKRKDRINMQQKHLYFKEHT